MAFQFAVAAALWGIVPALVVKVLVALGIGFVTFQGADVLVTIAEAQILANFNGLPANMLAVAQMAGFADGLQMVLAAYAAQIAVIVATGALTRVKVA
jgi:hypothetical protein